MQIVNYSVSVLINQKINNSILFINIVFDLYKLEYPKDNILEYLSFEQAIWLIYCLRSIILMVNRSFYKLKIRKSLRVLFSNYIWSQGIKYTINLSLTFLS